jgi:osmotically-inducible protein OsmY
MLTGQVESTKLKARATEIVKNVKGVKHVFNDLVVGKIKDNHVIANFAKDTAITTKIRSSMLANKHIHSVNFSVKTIKNVVYIVGIARSQHELDLVNKIAHETAGVQQVITHVRVEGKSQIK